MRTLLRKLKRIVTVVEAEGHLEAEPAAGAAERFARLASGVGTVATT
jgi:hypothetical protein